MDRQVVLEVSFVQGLVAAAMVYGPACLLVVAAAKLVAAELERESLVEVPLDTAAGHVVAGHIAGPTAEPESARQPVLVDASMKVLHLLLQEVASS